MLYKERKLANKKQGKRTKLIEKFKSLTLSEGRQQQTIFPRFFSRLLIRDNHLALMLTAEVLGVDQGSARIFTAKSYVSLLKWFPGPRRRLLGGRWITLRALLESMLTYLNLLLCFCRSIQIKLTSNAFAQALPASTASRRRISAHLTFQPRLEAPTKGKNENPGNELLYGHAHVVEDICLVPLICPTVVYLVES